MKLTSQQLLEIIEKELGGISEEFLQEGFFDSIKGAAGEAGNKIKNTATAVKNKVGQVAGDIKNAGAQASLKADVKNTSQQAKNQVSNLVQHFSSLLSRAEKLNMTVEIKELQAEIQALKNYTETTTKETEDTYDEPPEATSAPVATNAPRGIDLPPMPPKSSPSPVDMSEPGKPFDWRSDKARQQTSATPSSTKSTSKPSQKPKIKTKMDKDHVMNLIKKYGTNSKKIEKLTGLTHNEIVRLISG